MPLIAVHRPYEPTCRLFAVFESVDRNSLFRAAVISPYRDDIISPLSTAKFPRKLLKLSAMLNSKLLTRIELGEGTGYIIRGVVLRQKNSAGRGVAVPLHDFSASCRMPVMSQKFPAYVEHDLVRSALACAKFQAGQQRLLVAMIRLRNSTAPFPISQVGGKSRCSLGFFGGFWVRSDLAVDFSNIRVACAVSPILDANMGPCSWPARTRYAPAIAGVLHQLVFRAS